MSGIEVLAIMVPVIVYSTAELIKDLMELYKHNKERKAKLRRDLEALRAAAREVKEENPQLGNILLENSGDPSRLGHFLNENEFAINGRPLSNFINKHTKLAKMNKNKISTADKDKLKRMIKLAKEQLEVLEKDPDPRLKGIKLEYIRVILDLAEKYSEPGTIAGGSRKTSYVKKSKRATRKSKIDL